MMMKKDKDNSEINDWLLLDRILDRIISEIGYSGCTGTECANCQICETDIYDYEVTDDD